MRHIGQWTVDPRRAVLLVHDMHGFGGAPAEPSVNAARLRRGAATTGVPVAYTSVRRGLPLSPSNGDWLLTDCHQLRALMWRSGRDQLVLCGVYAHALTTAVPDDIQPFVVADAIAAFATGELDHAVVSTDVLLSQLDLAEAA